MKSLQYKSLIYLIYKIKYILHMHAHVFVCLSSFWKVTCVSLWWGHDSSNFIAIPYFQCDFLYFNSY